MKKLVTFAFFVLISTSVFAGVQPKHTSYLNHLYKVERLLEQNKSDISSSQYNRYLAQLRSSKSAVYNAASSMRRHDFYEFIKPHEKLLGDIEQAVAN